MKYFFILLAILVVCFVVLTLFKYFKLKEFDKIISVCVDNLNETFDRLDKEITNILNSVKDDKIKEIYIVNNENLELFERENMLFEISWSINKYFDDKKVKEKEKKILRSINNIDEETQGLKDYYNLNSVRYNELYNKIPFVYIFRLFGLNSKKIFKLRKLENYEILKD